MDAKRLEELLSEIWTYAFAILDRELDLTGEDAGLIATATVRCVVLARTKI